MSRRPLILGVCGLAIGMIGLLASSPAQAKDPEIKDGIAGTVVKVDATKDTITIADKSNRERTYSITNETIIVGPRGGVVHRRLKDHRFHGGLPITVVADGNTAVELHLGYDRKAKEAGETPSPTRSRTFRSQSPSETPTTNDDSSTPSSSPAPSTPSTRTSRFRGVTQPKQTSETPKDEEDEDEFPGKIKSVDAARHMLVITLVNGNDRSFLVSSAAKLTVNNRESRHGLSDTSLKPGLPLTVVTEPGGRKVREIKVSTSLLRRLRKAS
jgi:hypothetical protein